MNTKTTIAIFATVAILAAAVMPTLMTQASAKISPPSCTNPSGAQPPGQQPACKNDKFTQNPARNPAGHAPPGQQP